MAFADEVLQAYQEFRRELDRNSTEAAKEELRRQAEAWRQHPPRPRTSSIGSGAAARPSPPPGSPVLARQSLPPFPVVSPGTAVAAPAAATASPAAATKAPSVPQTVLGVAKEQAATTAAPGAAAAAAATTAAAAGAAAPAAAGGEAAKPARKFKFSAAAQAFVPGSAPAAPPAGTAPQPQPPQAPAAVPAHGAPAAAAAVAAGPPAHAHAHAHADGFALADVAPDEPPLPDLYTETMLRLMSAGQADDARIRAFAFFLASLSRRESYCSSCCIGNSADVAAPPYAGRR
jgi:hypothetical protein